MNAPTPGVDYYAPFGGNRLSSHGPREQGRAAREFFTSTRTLTIVAPMSSALRLAVAQPPASGAAEWGKLEAGEGADRAGRGEWGGAPALPGQLPGADPGGFRVRRRARDRKRGTVGRLHGLLGADRARRRWALPHDRLCPRRQPASGSPATGSGLVTGDVHRPLSGVGMAPGTGDGLVQLGGPPSGHRDLLGAVAARGRPWLGGGGRGGAPRRRPAAALDAWPPTGA